MHNTSNELVIKTSDGFDIQAAYFSSSTPSKQIILIVPGVGVKAKFYEAFAKQLAQNGLPTYTFDYRGIGKSKIGHLKGFNATVSDWAELDIEAMLQYLFNKHYNQKINIIAHSGGGTILGLAPSVKKASQILMVASPLCLRSNYEGWSYIKMSLIVLLLYPVISSTLGYFPSKLFRIGEDLPKGVALEWAKWGRNLNGMNPYIGDKIQRFHNIHAPMMTISFEHDFFASKKTVLGLSTVYKNAHIQHPHFDENNMDKNAIGHFSFFKKKFIPQFLPFALSFFNKKNSALQR